ncbi:MAG: hypothetical protein SV583_02715 [Pseudomonadota bacterium]|nr:hypothetical protein [Pseudomonadota bacterium]
MHEPWGALLARAYLYLRRAGVDGRQAALVVAELTDAVAQSGIDAEDYDWVEWLQTHPQWKRHSTNVSIPWPRLNRRSISYQKRG